MAKRLIVTLGLGLLLLWQSSLVSSLVSAGLSSLGSALAGKQAGIMISHPGSDPFWPG